MVPLAEMAGSSLRLVCFYIYLMFPCALCVFILYITYQIFVNCFSCVKTEGAEEAELWVIRRDRVKIGCDYFSGRAVTALSDLQDKTELNTSNSNTNFQFSRLLILRITVFRDLTPCVLIETYGLFGEPSCFSDRNYCRQEVLLKRLYIRGLEL